MAASVREKETEDNVENVSEYQEVVERYEGKLGRKVVRKVSHMPIEMEEIH